VQTLLSFDFIFLFELNLFLPQNPSPDSSSEILYFFTLKTIQIETDSWKLPKKNTWKNTSVSDTHSHIDDTILKYVAQADEVWHAGDIGNLAVTDDKKS
jgi:hypothetical protein